MNANGLLFGRIVQPSCLGRATPTLLVLRVCGPAGNTSIHRAVPNWRGPACSLAWCCTFCLRGGRSPSSRARSSACSASTPNAASPLRTSTTSSWPCLVLVVEIVDIDSLIPAIKQDLCDMHADDTRAISVKYSHSFNHSRTSRVYRPCR